MMKKNTKTNGTLKKVARILLALVLVVAQVTTALPALAAETTETVSNTSTVTVDGVKYTTLLKQGQVQLTVDSKVIILSKENVMAAACLDKYGTVWMISYSGRCSGYNYSLQKNEASANLHTYVNNAESFVLDSNKLAVEIQTTTGKVNVPTLEEFKKLAGITSSNEGNNTGDNNTNNGNNNTGNNTDNGTNDNLNLVETKTLADKQYTFIVTNGVAQVVVDDKVIAIPDKNICEIGLDSNGTIIVIVNNNGVKEARWFNPSLQEEVKTNLLSNNAICLLKDSNELKLVTGVVANSSIVKVLTLDEQKKLLGLTGGTITPPAVTVNWERVVKQGDNKYVVYDKNGKRLTSYKFKNNTVTWRGVKFKNVKRVCAIRKSKNLAFTTLEGSVVIVSFETLQKKTIFTATAKVKAVRYTYGNRGFGVSFVTSDGTRKSLKNY